MIEGLKPYPEYKESGVRYAPKIPSSWKTMRNGSLFQQRNDTGHPDLPVLEVSLKTGVRVRDFQSSNRKQVMSDFSKYKKAAQGEIAYNMMRMWQGAVGVAPVDGLVSPAYVVARPTDGVDSEYYSRLFRGELYKGEIDAASRGIVKDRNRLYWEQFKQIWSITPPPEDQNAIIRFLDHANRKVDGFIRAKRKLIGLLSEQKQTIIHRAVTRGLDLDVPMKPSDLDWLGEIPEHWKVAPIKRVLSSMDYGTSESSADGGSVPVLTMGNIKDGHVNLAQSGGIPKMPRGLELRKDDLLFNRTNSPDLVGKVGLVSEDPERPTTFASYLVRMRVVDDCNSVWLNLMLNSSRFWAFARSQALLSLHQANLNSTRYSRMSIPIPPRTEQDEIASFLRGETLTIETAISRTEREISLMQEYRTRLTADIVTGKLDVRDAAADLPDLTEESETEAPFENELDEEEEALTEEADE